MFRIFESGDGGRETVAYVLDEADAIRAFHAGWGYEEVTITERLYLPPEGWFTYIVSTHYDGSVFPYAVIPTITQPLGRGFQFYGGTRSVYLYAKDHTSAKEQALTLWKEYCGIA